MVTNVCWAAAGFTFYQNVHLHCLNEELQHTMSGGLKIEDFPDCPVNFYIPQVLEQGARLPQDENGWLDRHREIEQECWRRRNA